MAMKSMIKLLTQINSTRKLPQGIILTLVLTSLLACGMGITNNNPSLAVPNTEQRQTSQNNLPKSISRKLLLDASKRSGVKTRDLKITQVTTKTFSNPCAFQFGEICTREYRPIPGWEVVVKVKNQSWTYHVNKSGSQIILDPKVSTNKLPKNIADKILKDAAQRSSLPINAIKITQSTQKTFSNACVLNFGEICTQQYDPVEGWVVIVKVKNQSWTYHTDKTGSSVVLDPKINATLKN